MTALTRRILAEVSERAQRGDPAGAALEPALSETELDEVESAFGFRLPRPVRQLYGAVGNGGFGPGQGFIGLRGGRLSELGRDAVAEFEMLRAADPSDPGWSWPEMLVPLCHWGNAVYTCVDCSRAAAPVSRFDPAPVERAATSARRWDLAWSKESPSLRVWLEDWLAGSGPRAPEI